MLKIVNGRFPISSAFLSSMATHGTTYIANGSDYCAYARVDKDQSKLKAASANFLKDIESVGMTTWKN